MIWLFLVLIAVILFFGAQSALRKQKLIDDAAMTFRLSRKGWDLYVSPYDAKVLGLNRELGKIVVGTISSPHEFDIPSIASVEIVRDGASVSSTNRGSQLGGAAIGAIALGPLGLLVGGLSGTKRQRSTIQNLAVKLIIDDRFAPVHTIEFFRSPAKDGTDAKSPVLKKPVADMERFHALLVGAIRVAPQLTTPKPSATDEISRLWDLKCAGAITADEYDRQKARILIVQAVTSFPAQSGQ